MVVYLACSVLIGGNVRWMAKSVRVGAVPRRYQSRHQAGGVCYGGTDYWAGSPCRWTGGRMSATGQLVSPQNKKTS